MSGDITLTGTLSINNKKLSIDLNGHTITAANNQRAFNISNGGTLEIKDSVGEGIIQGNGTVTGSGGAIYMEGSGSALAISGGTIQGFTGFGWMQIVGSNHERWHLQHDRRRN